MWDYWVYRNKSSSPGFRKQIPQIHWYNIARINHYIRGIIPFRAWNSRFCLEKVSMRIKGEKVLYLLLLITLSLQNEKNNVDLWKKILNLNLK